MATAIDIQISDQEKAAITQTMVRTAIGRLQSCMMTLKMQNPNGGELIISSDLKALWVNALIQDFSQAENPQYGSTSLNHTNATDKPRDLEMVRHFNRLQSDEKKAIAEQALTQMVGNFNASPASGLLTLKM